jgi:hypothetical protein
VHAQISNDASTSTSQIQATVSLVLPSVGSYGEVTCSIISMSNFMNFCPAVPKLLYTLSMPHSLLTRVTDYSNLHTDDFPCFIFISLGSVSVGKLNMATSCDRICSSELDAMFILWDF